MPTSAPIDSQQDGVLALDQLEVGQTAVISRMDEANHVMLIRLKTMGMHEGRAVRMLRQGSRLIIQCAGTRIGLSHEVACHIFVEPKL